MNVIIGCPVCERAWILPAFFSHISKQTAEVEIKFLFNYGKSTDRTVDILLEYGSDILHSSRRSYPGDHKWNNNRRSLMTHLRNELLDVVCEKDPDYYFSLDSDILIPPDCLTKLIADQKDAVSPQVNMSSKKIAPNVMTFKNNQALRENYSSNRLQKVDIIMAAVLMSRRVYKNVRYKFHSQGEDIGWSQDAKKKGYDLWWDPRIICRHVMKEIVL